MRRNLCLSLPFLLLLIPFVPAAPTVTSSTMPDSSEWYSPNVMRFSWDEGQTGNQYAYVIDHNPDTDPGDTANISENTLSLPPQLDGVWYLHIKQIPGSGITHFKFQIDRTPPRTVSGTHAEYQEDSGGIEVTWNETTDLLSGIKGYTIYRQHNESDFDIRYAKVVVENTPSTTYLDVDENFVQGFTYFYKIVAKDLAGNSGPTSLFGFAAIPRKCDAKVTLSPSFDAATRTLTVEVTAENANITNANLRVMPPGSSQIIDMVTDEDDTSGFTGTADLSDFEDGDSNILLNAVDTGFDSCNKTLAYPIDSSNPTVELDFPTENAILENEVTLSATAKDTGTFQTGIKKVEFFYKEEKIKIGETTTGPGNTFTYTWDTTTADNGRFPLYAVAYDGGNNTAEASVLISLNNKIVARQNANTLLTETRDLKDDIADLNALLLSKGLQLESFNEKVALADENFAIAENSFEREQFDSAERYAQSSKDLYQSLLDTIQISPYKEANYQFLSSNLDLFFDGVGLSPNLREEAKRLTKPDTIHRTLVLEKVQEDADTEFYIASVNISYTNKDTNTQSVQILEVIPKDLIPNAAELKADANFDIVRPDPIVRFLLTDLLSGETKTVSYVLYNSLSREEADVVIDQALINSFETPPIILSSITPTSASDFGFVLPSFDLGPDSLVIAGGFAVVVLIAVIVFLFLYIQKNKSRHRPRQAGLKAAFPMRRPSSGWLGKLRQKIPINRKQKTLKDVFK